ncbi:MAG: radical SAM family heme chaperone HemW [Bacteroidota bacterium]
MPGLYLHIPFCEHKCVYCDFYSLAPTEERMDGEKMMSVFVNALLQEVSLRSAAVPADWIWDTIFLGGGTPSLMTAGQMDSILSALHSHYRISADAEITMEANPGTVSEERLAAFRSAGVNRISFGVQSFHEDELRFLTRIHSADAAEASVRAARRAGFDDLNIDLIFALPGHTLERWKTTLERALALAPTHLSCYSLIVEPNTPLLRMVETRQVTLLDPETDAVLYEYTLDRLERAGFEQYEVSNFALPGRRSRHNDNYWNHGPYLGFGPSAHSFIPPMRSWNIANLSTYHARIAEGRLPTTGSEELRPEQMVTEAIFLGLRSDGLDTARFDLQFGRRFLVEHEQSVESLVKDGLARLDGTVLRLTKKGYLVCDEICATFG